MGFIDWLTEPIRETHSLAPSETPRGLSSLGRGTSEIERGTFEKLELQRQAAARHRRRILLAGVPMLPVLGFIVYGLCHLFGVNEGDIVVWIFISLVIGTLMLRAMADAGFWIFRKTAKFHVLSAVAAEQGLQYEMGRVESETTDPFNEQELFGMDTNSGDSEDVFSGKIDDVDFLLFEARREKVSRSNNSTSTTLAFHGLCLRLSFPKRFKGTTRVLSESGMFNKLYEVGTDIPLERVRLEDARFEKQFEVVSTDQVEARYLLTPAFMERLVAAQRILGPRTRLRAGFHDRDLLLTLDTLKNRSLWARMRGSLNRMHHFEVKDANRPVEQMEMIRQFEEELAVCKDIVRTLKLNMRTRI